MQEATLDIPILQPGEKVIGLAYLTEDGEIIFSMHPGATEVVLVEPPQDSTGPWAVRCRPSAHTHSAAGR